MRLAISRARSAVAARRLDSGNGTAGGGSAFRRREPGSPAHKDRYKGYLLDEWTSRRAASASLASRMAVVKNFGDWPANRLSAVKLLMVATAPEFTVEEGRMTEQSGRLVLMN